MEVVHTPGDLVPGLYSVAASADGLQLVEAKIEVRTDQALRVLLTFEPMVKLTFDSTAYPAYPPGTFSYGPYGPYGSSDFGSVTVRAMTEDTLIVVTGPNGYSADAWGYLEAGDLLPGVYSVAATGEGYAMAETKVEVLAAQTLELVPTLLAIE